MNIKVMSRSEAKKTAHKAYIPTIIISITDILANNNTFNKNPNIFAVLHLKFDDEEDPSIKAISIEQAKEIADFVNKWKDRVEQIIVHCEAGISRSSGVAAAIMKFINGDDMPIFRNPRFCPNMTCYRKVLEAFLGTTIDESELAEKENTSIEAWKVFNGL